MFVGVKALIMTFTPGRFTIVATIAGREINWAGVATAVSGGFEGHFWIFE